MLEHFRYFLETEFFFHEHFRHIKTRMHQGTHANKLSHVFPCFQASQPDELTIEEQEILEVIDDGDMEDWVKVRLHTFELNC